MDVKPSDLQSAAEVLERMHKQFAGLATAASVLRDLGSLTGAHDEVVRLYAARKSELAVATAELAVLQQEVGKERAKAVQTAQKAAADAEAVRNNAADDAERCVADAKAEGERRLAQADVQVETRLQTLEGQAREATEYCAEQRRLAAEAMTDLSRAQADLEVVLVKIAKARDEARKILGVEA